MSGPQSSPVDKWIIPDIAFSGSKLILNHIRVSCIETNKREIMISQMGERLELFPVFTRSRGKRRINIDFLPSESC
jgi:hypothetical protein